MLNTAPRQTTARRSQSPVDIITICVLLARIWVQLPDWRPSCVPTLPLIDKDFGPSRWQLAIAGYRNYPCIRKGFVTAACDRFCCKSRKSPGDNFPAKGRHDRRPSIPVLSIALPRSPVSLRSGDEVPHIFTRKSRLRPREFLISSAKRLLQQNRPDPEVPTAGSAGPLIEVDLPCRRSEWHGSF